VKQIACTKWRNKRLPFASVNVLPAHHFRDLPLSMTVIQSLPKRRPEGPQTNPSIARRFGLPIETSRQTCKDQGVDMLTRRKIGEDERVLMLSFQWLPRSSASRPPEQSTATNRCVESLLAARSAASRVGARAWF
jgi:hypothetical protein